MPTEVSSIRPAKNPMCPDVPTLASQKTFQCAPTLDLFLDRNILKNSDSCPDFLNVAPHVKLDLDHQFGTWDVTTLSQFTRFAHFHVFRCSGVLVFGCLGVRVFRSIKFWMVKLVTREGAIFKRPAQKWPKFWER